jgi:ABC-type branched-subunit amino acid transport system substrate-binding protein
VISPRSLLAAVVALAATPACVSQPPQDGAEIAVGVFLSYTGYLSAHSINSERALIMAVEAANAAGGVSGHRLRIVTRDAASDPRKATMLTRELVDAGVALVIGPDTTELAFAARASLVDRTVILPSFTTSDVLLKPPSWFVVAPPIGRIACNLVSQLRADRRSSPLLILDASGYNSSLATALANNYGLPRYVLPTDTVPDLATVAPLVSSSADSFVLAAVPSSAIPLVFALLAHGALPYPTAWYLSPTLHSPVFLDVLPKGALAGAQGVSQGTTADGDDFRARFVARWDDRPLDDAYSFFDAGALAVLSLQRALARERSIPGGTGLSKHIIAVSHAGGVPVRWNELDRGIERLQNGEEITYQGLSGRLEFDTLGQSAGAAVSWWTIGPEGFTSREAPADCPAGAPPAPGGSAMP